MKIFKRIAVIVVVFLVFVFGFSIVSSFFVKENELTNINPEEYTAEQIDAIFAASLDDTNTTKTFKSWYTTAKTVDYSRYEMLERFFAMCAKNNNQTQTVRFASPTASSDTRGTPLGDLAGKKAQNLSTDLGVVENANSWLDAQGNARTDGEDWASENRMTWYIRANALSLSDGNMNVVAIEGIDDSFDITGETAPVYTFQLSPWFKETDDGTYLVKSWRANYAQGYSPFNDNVDLNGNPRVMTWHASFGGSMTSTGNKLTSGAGNHPLNFTSAAQGDAYAKNWNTNEGAGVDANAKWVLYEWQRRHFNLENSGIADGCVNYDYILPSSFIENGVRRVVINAYYGDVYVVGSNVYIGDSSQNVSKSLPVGSELKEDFDELEFKEGSGTKDGNRDLNRANTTARNVSNGFTKIISKEYFSENNNDYIVLNFDLSFDINVTASTYVYTAPWDTGSTEALSGHADGSCNSLTDGTSPLRVAGMEVLIGCYYNGLDTLYNCSSVSGGYTYAVYECKNSRKYASSVTSDYKNTGITFTAASGWNDDLNYVKSFYSTSKPVLCPTAFGGSETTYLKSAFYGAHSAGVHCPWRFGGLTGAGHAGLACEAGHHSPSFSYWGGAPWLAGAEKMRGEFAG